MACFLWRPETRLFPLNACTAWTHIQEFQLSHKGVSEVSERARKWSEQSERTNVAKDQVARLKRDGLWLEMPAKCASRSAAFIQYYITEANLCLLFTHAPIILSKIRLFRLSPDFLLLPAWTNDQKPEWGNKGQGTYASTEEKKITSPVTTAVKSITSFCKVRLSVICTWITSGFCVALT